MVDLIGRFKIIRRRGSGAMGDVYWAHDPALDRDVAVKLIAPELLEDSSMAEIFRERFQHEANIGARLNHEHIAAVYETGQTQNGGNYLVTEYVPGDSLGTLLKRRHPFSIQEIIRIISQLQKALDYAHGQGVVHRDLKPDNIVITPQGSAKILDFGLAKLITDDRRYLGDEGDCTPEYASPEQLEYDTETSRSSDIYSFGVLAHQLITGQLPAGSADASVNGPPLQNRHPPVPAYYRVFWQVFHPQITTRYPTAGAFVKDLLGSLRQHGFARFCFDRNAADWSLQPPEVPPDIQPKQTSSVTEGISVSPGRMYGKVCLALALCIVLGAFLVDTEPNSGVGRYAVFLADEDNRIDTNLSMAFSQSLEATDRQIGRSSNLEGLFHSPAGFQNIWQNPGSIGLINGPIHYVLMGKIKTDFSVVRTDTRMTKARVEIHVKVISLTEGALIQDAIIEGLKVGFDEQAARQKAIASALIKFNDNELNTLPKINN